MSTEVSRRGFVKGIGVAGAAAAVAGLAGCSPKSSTEPTDTPTDTTPADQRMHRPRR